MKKKTLSVIIWGIITLSSLFSQDLLNIKLITVPKNKEIINKIYTLNLDFLMEKKGEIYILAHREDRKKLDQLHIPYTIKHPPASSPLSILTTTQNGVNGAYHAYGELEKELLSLETNYPQTAKVFDIGDSIEKRNIYALKISDNVYVDEEETEIIFLGCHHAREWISVEVPLLLGKYLAENYSKDLEIKKIVDQSEIWIIPLINPDGLQYSIHFYRFWRKNRRLNQDGSYGVDLNRNYGYKWGYDNTGSSPQPSSNVYRGKSPFSEPEIQSIRDFFSIKNFQALLSFHSYSQVILYPWSYTTRPSPHDKQMEEMAAKMSQLMKPVHGRVYQYGQSGELLYLTNGDTTDWAYGVCKIPAFTIELPPVDFIHGAFFNSEEDINRIFKENLPAALYLIDWAINHSSPSPPLSGPRKENFPYHKEISQNSKLYF